MNESPPIQYATTSDGFHIAYTVQGAGPPLLCLPFGVFSHAQQVWVTSSVSPLLHALAKRFRVVYYDCRGTGLSQRDLTPDTDFASFLLDLHAVFDASGIEKPIILGDGPLCHLAVRFTQGAPHRVAALALLHCAVSFSEHLTGMAGLAKANWDYILTVWAGSVPKTPAPEQPSSARAAALRGRTTQKDMLRALHAFEISDISDALSRLQVPALVLHPSRQEWVNQEGSAHAAALIPNGRLAVLGGTDFYGGEEAAAAIESFYRELIPGGHAGAVASPLSVLSVREVEVLKLLATGRSNQQIAEDLVISLNTVTRHISHIYAKTGVANRAQAAVYARDRGLA